MDEEIQIMVAGEPFEVKFTVLAGGVPDPAFAGFTAKIQLRKNNAQGELIGEWDDTSAEITRDDVEAVITLKIPALVTNSFSFNLGFMDLLMLDDADGRRSAKLKIKLDRGVTR